MRKTFKEFFAHFYIWLYIIIAFSLWLYLAYQNAILEYWYLVFVLALAPFYEWVLHKYVLHAKGDKENEWKMKYMDRLHRDHHKEPKVIELLFAPLSGGLFIPFSFFIIFFIFSQNTVISVYGAALSLTYYLYYEWIHLAHHIDEYKPITKRGKELKKAHQWHHYKNENYWWGVTSSLGDKLLGTYPRPIDVNKSITVKDITALPENYKE